MKTYAKTLLLQDNQEKIDAYKRHHAAVWPEVLADLRQSSGTNMRIWLLGRRMFLLMETRDDYDPTRGRDLAARSPRVAEWDQLMRTLQERAPEAPPNQWWADMDLVFDMSWPQHRAL